MMNSIIYLGLFNKKIGAVLYWSSIFFFIIGFSICVVLGSALVGLLFLAAMIIFSLKWAILRFVKIEGNKVIIQSVFFKDLSYELNALETLSGYLPFVSIMRISFKGGKSYFFWGGNDEKNIELLKKQGLLK